MAPRSASPATTAVAPAPTTELNIAAALGTITNDPVVRELPSGSALLSMSVTVRSSTSASTSLPIVWFDPPAKAQRLKKGDHVLAVGRLSRRFFRAGGSTQSRTELVAERIETTRAKVACRRMLNGIEAHLEATIVEGFL